MKPEDYWINRGSDLIGLDVLEKGYESRQASTYDAIAVEIAAHRWSVLDVGCNVGALEQFLRSNCYRPNREGYHGVDSNAFAVGYCRKNNLNANVSELQKLNYEAQTFDCVVVKDVLEHLDRLEHCKEAFRVAKHAVILSFFIPPKEGGIQIEDIHQTKQGYYHNKYSEDRLILIANFSGFHLEKRIDTREKDGNPNRIYVFLRNL